MLHRNVGERSPPHLRGRLLWLASALILGSALIHAVSTVEPVSALGSQCIQSQPGEVGGWPSGWNNHPRLFNLASRSGTGDEVAQNLAAQADLAMQSGSAPFQKMRSNDFVFVTRFQMMWISLQPSVTNVSSGSGNLMGMWTLNEVSGNGLGFVHGGVNELRPWAQQGMAQPGTGLTFLATPRGYADYYSFESALSPVFDCSFYAHADQTYELWTNGFMGQRINNANTTWPGGGQLFWNIKHEFNNDWASFAERLYVEARGAPIDLDVLQFTISTYQPQTRLRWIDMYFVPPNDQARPNVNVICPTCPPEGTKAWANMPVNAQKLYEYDLLTGFTIQQTAGGVETCIRGRASCQRYWGLSDGGGDTYRSVFVWDSPNGQHGAWPFMLHLFWPSSYDGEVCRAASVYDNSDGVKDIDIELSWLHGSCYTMNGQQPGYLTLNPSSVPGWYAAYNDLPVSVSGAH